MALDALVTGGAGVLGNAIVADLRKAGCKVTSCGRIPGPGVDVHWDLSRDLAPSGNQRPSIVIHAAAKVGRFLQPLDDAMPLLEVNVMGTLRLARWCASVGVQKLVIISGALVYGTWETPRDEGAAAQPWLAGSYAVSKWLGEQGAKLVEKEGCSLSILRLSSLWGAGYSNGLPQKLLRQARETGALRLDPPFDDSFDLLHVQDAARTVTRCALSTGSGLWNVGGGTTTTIRAVAEACSRATNVELSLSGAAATRPARAINWVDDRKARRDFDHANTVTLDSEMILMTQKNSL